jgi:hypothetical protein
MQQWEYKFVECIYFQEDWHPAFEGGEEIHNWKAGGNITKYSNLLGAQGWEMVNFASTATGTHSDYREFFRVAYRRPVP